MFHRKKRLGRKKASRSRISRGRAHFEQLESRRLLATFQPDTFEDDNDLDFSAGDFSLREAIIRANNNDETDTIILGTGTYELTIRGAGEDGALTGDLDIGPDNLNGLTIRGSGAGQTVISADNGTSLNDRVFQIFDLASVLIEDLTITGGSSPTGTDGGAVLTAASVVLRDVEVTGNEAGADGGGIANQGVSASLFIENSVVTDNLADGFGGGIHNMSSMAIERVTVSGNMAEDGAGVTNRSNAQANGSLSIKETTISGNTANSDGGGIYNTNGSVALSLINSTVSTNFADDGAGIFNTNGATMAMVSVTVTNNDAASSGVAVQSNGGVVEVTNTIIAGNVDDDDVDGVFSSAGFNLIGNATGSSGFGAAGDLVGTNSNSIDPVLGPLHDNGGPTETHAISWKSPAWDAGDVSGIPLSDPSDATKDQRDFPRPVGMAVDIGAYELSMDLGDAPDPTYPTLLASDGAAHAFGAPDSPLLGTRIDTELDGQPNITATGDDITDLDDEDGVGFPGTIRVGQLDARVNVTATGPGILDAWLDFHGDGNWDASVDQIFVSEPLTAGLNQLEFVVPPDARVGQTYARFRISSEGVAGPRGFAFDGEVEDYRVNIVALTGTGTYSGGPSLGTSTSRDLALADVDKDGDLDAFVANDSSQPNRVWVNQGGDQGGVPGVFVNSGQSIGFSGSQAVAMGDVDRDGDLDAFVANGSEPDRVYLNQGGDQGGTLGVFATNGQALGLGTSRDVVLGDLDGDGDLDAVGATLSVNRVLFNQGGIQGGTEGQFDDPQSFGNATGYGAALGDFDQDGDLDVFIANAGANRVWINQGNAQGGNLGELSNSGQSLGTSDSRAVVVGDLDDDGDLDAFIANAGGQANRVWINQGGIQAGMAGEFLDSGQTIGSSDSRDAALGDIDGDGDLDVYVANSSGQPNRVYINQGGAQAGVPGVFLSNGQALGVANSDGVQVGDLDLDGDLDAMVANASPNRIWFNAEVQPTPAYDFSAANYAAAEDDATTNVVMLTRSVATSGASSVDVVLTGVSASSGADFVAGPITVNFAPGEITRPVPITLIEDSLDESNETIGLSLANFSPDGEAGTTQPTATLSILDDDPMPTVTLSADSESIDEVGGQSILTATLSEVSGRTVSVALGFTGDATGGGVDYTAAPTTIVIPAGSMTGTSTITAVDDLLNDDEETIVVDITNVTNGTESGSQQVTVEIDDNDEPGSSTTSVSLLNSTLVIEDIIDEDTDDQLMLALAGASLQIIDPSNTLSTNIPGATGDGTNQVTVPLSLFSTIFVDTKGGDDSLTLASTLSAALASVLTFDGGSDFDSISVAGDGITLSVSQLTDVDSADLRSPGDNTLNFTFSGVLKNVDGASDALIARTDGSDEVGFDSGWSIQTTFVSGDDFFRTIRQGSANVHLSGPWDWQNPLEPLDVSGDGEVVAIDALQIINEINGPDYSNPTTGELDDAKSLPLFPFRFYDTTGDGFVTPRDVLLVINFLNLASSGEGGEGEATPRLQVASPEPVGVANSGARTPNSGANSGSGKATVAFPTEPNPENSRDEFFASMGTVNDQTIGQSRRTSRVLEHRADEMADLLGSVLADQP